MRVIPTLINHLEKSESKHKKCYINLAKLNAKQRERAFNSFGEGNKELTRLLKVAYKHNIESMFCCCGHGGPNGYVVFKANEKNIRYLQNVGKALSNYNVTTRFDYHYTEGKRVCFRGVDTSDWFGIAADVIGNIRKYDISNPSSYYDETINIGYIPLDYRIKMNLINILKKVEEKNLLIRFM